MRAAALWCCVVTAVLAPPAGGAIGWLPIEPRTVIAVYIPKGQPTAVHLKLANGRDRRILTVSSLPQTSREGFGMAAQAFTSAALAPDRAMVAFATLGRVHGWVGLLTLRTGRIRELLFLFEGQAEDVVWSPDGRHLAMTTDGPSGLRSVGVHDVRTGTEPAGLASLLRKRFFDRDQDTYGPAWVSASILRFNARSVGTSGQAERWEVRLDGSRLRRITP